MIDTATESDLEAIVALEESFPPNQRWSIKSWQEELGRPDRLVLVFRSPDIRGVILLVSGHDVADLYRIVVEPKSRRRGIAKVLLQAALEEFPSTIMLEVREDNEPARKLYESFGFEIISRRKNYYGAGLDALIYERNGHE